MKLKAYSKKEKPLINYLNFYFKKLEKENKTKFKVFVKERK